MLSFQQLKRLLKKVFNKLNILLIYIYLNFHLNNDVKYLIYKYKCITYYL